MNVNVSDKLIYFAAGCGIGAVLGLLFAPRSGQEIRQNLTGKVDELTHRVQDRVQSGVRGTAGQTWHSIVDKGKTVASIGRQRLNESIEAGKRKFSEVSGEPAESFEGEDVMER